VPAVDYCHTLQSWAAIIIIIIITFHQARGYLPSRTASATIGQNQIKLQVIEAETHVSEQQHVAQSRFMEVEQLGPATFDCESEALTITPPRSPRCYESFVKQQRYESVRFIHYFIGFKAVSQIHCLLNEKNGTFID